MQITLKKICITTSNKPETTTKQIPTSTLAPNKPSSLESFNIHKPNSIPLKKKESKIYSPYLSIHNSSLSKQNTQLNNLEIKDLVNKYNSLNIKLDEYSTSIMLIHIYLIVKVFVSIYINIFYSQNNAVKSIGALLYHYTLRLFKGTMPVISGEDRTKTFYANEVRKMEPIPKELIPIWKNTDFFEKHSYIGDMEEVPVPSIPLTKEMEKTFEMEVFCNETMRIIGYFNRMILQVTLKFKNKVKRQMLQKKIELLKKHKDKVGIEDTRRYISGIISKIDSLKKF
jgi:hypothetical protein